MKKTIFRVGEYLGLLASLIFAYELIAADRHLPSLKTSQPLPEIGDFLIENDRELVFIDFDSNVFSLPDIYPAKDEFLIEIDQGRYLEFDWRAIRTQPLVKAKEERAEDQAFYFAGPVFVAVEEGEGDKYIKLLPAPYTDTTASQASCSRALSENNASQYYVTYVLKCML